MKSCVCYNYSNFDVFYYVAEIFFLQTAFNKTRRINFLSKKAWKSSDKTWKNEEILGKNMENVWNFKS